MRREPPAGSLAQAVSNARDEKEREEALAKLYLDPALATPVSLRGRRLRGADLRGAKLYGAILEGADLTGAFLDRAILRGADLSRAQLQGADLSEAKLQGADLGAAQLQGAVLWGAQLQGAVLSGAKLQGADLRGTAWFGTRIFGLNVSVADLRGAHARAPSEEERAQLRSAIEKSFSDPDRKNRVMDALGRVHEGTASWQPEPLPEASRRDVLLVRPGEDPSPELRAWLGEGITPEAYERALPGEDPSPELRAWLGEGITPEAYERALPRELARLVCGVEEPAIARGVVRRIGGKIPRFATMPVWDAWWFSSPDYRINPVRWTDPLRAGELAFRLERDYPQKLAALDDEKRALVDEQAQRWRE